LFQILGILAVLAPISFFINQRQSAMLGLLPMFVAPLTLAFTFQLTAEMAANHKFVLVSVLLLNIPVAGALARGITDRRLLPRAVAILLLLLCLASPSAYMIPFVRNAMTPVIFTMPPELKHWIVSETQPSDIFLSAPDVSNAMLLQGRKCYLAGPYFSFSAGYDYRKREALVRQALAKGSAEKVAHALNSLGIRFLAITPDFLETYSEATPALWENENPFLPRVFRTEERHQPNIYEVRSP
jgi:hypothetical protein